MTFTNKLAKFWVLLQTEIRRDTQNLAGFSAKYLWLFFPCFIYGNFFKSGVWQKSIQLDGHSMEFSLFLVSGLAVVRLIPLSIRIFDETLSEFKYAELTEWVQITPTSLWECFFAKAVWNGFRAVTELITLVVFAKLLIGTPLRPFFQIALMPPFILLFTAVAGIGMIISGLSLFFKKKGGFFNLFFQISFAFGGIFFPTRLFVGKLAFLSHISDSLPITHALSLMRFTLIHEKTPPSAAHELILAEMALGFSLIGFVLLEKNLILAKKNGGF